jgi:hypothetical protein
MPNLAYSRRAHGIATPQSELELVKQRLKRAIEIDQEREK